MKTKVILSLLFFFIICCSAPSDSEENGEMEEIGSVTVTITEYGFNSKGTWESGYVTNNTNRTIRNVRINARTELESAIVFTSPNVLDVYESGDFTTGFLQGKKYTIEIEILFD